MSGGRSYEPLDDEHRRARAAADDGAPQPEQKPALSDFRTDLDAAFDRDIERIHERAKELKANGVASVGYELASEDAQARQAFEKMEAARAEKSTADIPDGSLSEEGDELSHRPARDQADDERAAQPLGKYDSLRDAANSFGDIEMTDAQRERLDRLLGSSGGSGLTRESDNANSGPGPTRSDGGRGRSR